MDIVVFGLAALALLLALISLAVPAARAAGIPFPVAIAGVALVYGSAMAAFDLDITGGALDAYDLWFLESLALDSSTALYVFLPPLLFEMALAVNVRRLMDDIVLVLIMAVLAVVFATLLIGLSVWAASPLPLAACLLLGAAVATTDPAAVITTFRELGAPRRLLVLLEGESLLNDAAAIAIFAVLLAIIRNEAEPTLAGVAVGFLYGFGAGGAVGLVASFLASRLYPWLGRSAVAETSMTMALAYGAYLIAEVGIGASGVVAVVFAGLATGHAGFARMGPGNWATVRTVWTQIGFWANALIVVLVASATPGLLLTLEWQQLLLVAVVYAGAFLARFIVLFGGLKALHLAGLAEPMDTAQKTLVLWGGVRGAVTLVLALSLTEVSALGSSAPVVGALAAAFTLATLVVNASTLALVVRILGLDRLSPGDMALRERIVAGSLERVRKVISDLAGDRPIHHEALSEVETALAEQQGEAQGQADLERIAFGERLRLGLAILSGQEARLIRRAFEAGAIGPQALSHLRLTAERIADAGRSRGRGGYREAVGKSLRAGSRFRSAVWMHHWLRWDGPVRRQVELRLTALLETDRIVRALDTFADSTVAPMIGREATENLRALLAQRLDLVQGQIGTISLQYPGYAAALERVLIARTALRRERQQYHRLFNDGVIGPELRNDLLRNVDRRERRANQPPRLDLSLSPEALIGLVPLFSGLDDSQRTRIARRLHSRFVTPEQVILAEGERGTAMFFVASGALEVRGGATPVTLSNGDFFGELGLLQPKRRRRTSIVSLDFGRLLCLTPRDFGRLTARDPEIGVVIRAAAERQLSEGFQGAVAARRMGRHVDGGSDPAPSDPERTGHE